MSRQQIAAIQVKVDREFGIMDIGKKVSWNPEKRVFSVVEPPTHGYTVITYKPGCLATVDFTPLNAEIKSPENRLKTAQDVYDFFDKLEQFRKQISKELPTIEDMKLPKAQLI